MDRTRRNFLRGAAFFGAGMLAARRAAAGSPQQQPSQEDMKMPPGMKMGQEKTQAPRQPLHRLSSEGVGFLPVVTPDVPDLPFERDGEVKVFKLRAEPVKRKIVPFKTMAVWGYNGNCPGPTIQVRQGDRVRVIFENGLPESTTVHWHGLEVPIEMDGMPFISQKPVPPGGRFVYEFTVRQEGTFFYHSHGAMQEMMGMIGMFIAHPAKPYSPRVDHDYGIVLQEWAILPNLEVPNSANMEFNWLTFNGASAPAITPMIARLGSRVRIRLVNLGMDHHPIHLHGNQFVITGTEGGRAPESTWYPTNTVLVGVAQAKVVEFDAKYPGPWMLHCHLPHHMMNSMSDLITAVTHDRLITTADQTEDRAMNQMMTLAESVPFEHVHPSPVAPDANTVPGFPQDAFMEMGMDDAVAKPETSGLPPNWSAMMMGMMTLVRVLPDKEYEELMARIKSGTPNPPSRHQHEHPGD
jgi:FtsP/CotA-like multicopper oxidase with cupredoxin domain